MFLLVRSAFCIGAVALAAAGGGDRLGALVDHGGREAAQSLGRACLSSQDCLRIGMDIVGPAVLPAQAPAALRRPSGDTLQAADLQPAWIAPRSRGSARRASGDERSEPRPASPAGRFDRS